jgi:hypothetical protein
MVRAACLSSALHRAHQSDAAVAATTEDMTMANDHGYDCQQCGAHFDTRDQLDRHNKQQHTQQAGSSNVGSSSKSGSSSMNRDLNSRDIDNRRNS